MAAGAPPWQPCVEWSPLLLCTSLHAPILCECCMPRSKAKGRGRWKNKWLSLSHREGEHCATTLPAAISAFSISPALIVPSPSLKLGVHLAQLTLVNCTAVNQQLILVVSNMICIRVRKRRITSRWGNHCTTFIKSFASYILLLGKKAPSPSLLNSWYN